MAKKKEDGKTMNKLVFYKRRGALYSKVRIYGGLANSWDYGPLGIELKQRSKYMVEKFTRRDDVVGFDSAIIMHPRTWEASDI